MHGFGTYTFCTIYRGMTNYPFDNLRALRAAQNVLQRTALFQKNSMGGVSGLIVLLSIADNWILIKWVCSGR